MRLQILKILQKIFIPLELIGVLTLIIGNFMEDGLMYIGIAFILLATIYFIASFFPPSDTISNAIMVSIFKLLKIGCSVSLIGIMFNILNLAGNLTILYIGLAIIVLCLFVILIGILIKPDTIRQLKIWTFRGLVIAAFSAVLIAFPEILG